MLLVRAPVRISLAGGGTDLEEYYAPYGGMVVSAAIDKYFYAFVHPNEGEGVHIGSSDYRCFNRWLGDEKPIWDGDLRLPRAILHEYGVSQGLFGLPGVGDTAGHGPRLVELGGRGADKGVQHARRAAPEPGEGGGDGVSHRKREAGQALRQAGPVRGGFRRNQLSSISRRTASRSRRWPRPRRPPAPATNGCCSSSSAPPEATAISAAISSGRRGRRTREVIEALHYLK